MAWLDKITGAFNKDREPSQGKMRRLVARTKTPEGRREFLALVAAHPRLINATDKHNKSALHHAAAAGDTGTVEQLIGAGVMTCFFHDAIYAAAHNHQQAALDLLLAKGGVVCDDHIGVTENMACFYSEPGPNEHLSKQYFDALEMLKAAREAQEKRAVEAENAKMPGPLVLRDKLSVRGPLRLKTVPPRREFCLGLVLN